MRIGSTIGWGVFCAASWTWCIGMFLPLVMIDRFGWWGFIAFAAPNVLGCAAFGYLITDRAGSERLVRDHYPVMRGFSVITVAYHMFFLAMLCWFFLPVGEDRFWLAMIAPAAILSVGVVLSNLADRYWPILALAAYAFSFVVFARIGITPLADIPWTGAIDSINLWWLAPTLLFGFLLCPYLDLTFHRAFQRSPSRHAFGVFGITFLVMILLTCAYWDTLAGQLRWAVAAHIVVQSCFTIAAHVREIRVRAIASDPVGDERTSSHQSSAAHPAVRFLGSWVCLVLLTLLAVPVALVGEFIGDPRATAIDMYVRFLVFYGLIFPVYVLLFLARRNGHERTRRRLAAVASFLIIASIIYELGFIHHQYVLLPIPLAAVLIWWGYLRIRGGRGVPTESIESQPPIGPRE